MQKLRLVKNAMNFPLLTLTRSSSMQIFALAAFVGLLGLASASVGELAARVDVPNISVFVSVTFKLVKLD